MEKNKKVKNTLEILIIILFCLFFGSLYFTTPFYGDLNMIDEGQFAAWANHMLHGKLMFADIYITYGPMLVYPLYMLFKIFDPSAFLVRLLYGAGSTITGILMARLVINRLNIRQSLKWMVIVLLLFIPGMNIRQGLAYLTIFVLLKSEEKPIIWMFFSGIITVISFLITPEAGIFSLILVSLFLFWKSISVKNISLVLKMFWLFCLGILIVLLPFAIWAGREGWLVSYIQTTQDVLITFSGITLPNGQNFPAIFSLFPHSFSIFPWVWFVVSKDMLLYEEIFFYGTTLLYLLVKKIIRKVNKKDITLFYITLYGIFSYYLLIGRAGNFFLALTPVFLIFIIFADQLLTIFNKSKKKREKIIALLLLSFFCLWILRIILIFRPHFVNVTKVIPAITKYNNNPDRVGHILISEKQKQYIKDLQLFIAKNTTAHDTVFFLSNIPMMYMLTDRVNPTRYDLPFIANTEEKRLEILSDLEKSKPKYIFIDTKEWAVDGVSNEKRLPEVTIYTKKQYKKLKIIDGVEIYIVNGDGVI